MKVPFQFTQEFFRVWKTEEHSLSHWGEIAYKINTSNVFFGELEPDLHIRYDNGIIAPAHFRIADPSDIVKSRLA
jgi:hypothetical protein